MRQRFWVVGLAVFGFVVLIPIVYSKAKARFTNMQGNVSCEPSELVTVQNTSDVAAAVQRARAAGLTVKAASQGWAGSNESSCVTAGGIQIDTSGMNRILSVDTEKKQITVQPGMRLWDLNQATHKNWQLVLPIIQEYAEPTLGGLLGNATHGSSLAQASSSIQESVIALTVVNGRGEVQTITGEELDYYAGNLGVLGIITEMTLQLEPSFKVQAHLSSHDEDDLAQEILHHASGSYAAAVTWFPGQKKYTVTAYEKVPNETPGEAHNGQSEAAWWKRSLFPLVFKASHFGPNRAAMCFLEQQRYAMKAKSFYTVQYDKPVDPAIGWVHEMTSFVCRDRCPFKPLPYALEEIAIDQSSLPAFINEAQDLFHKTGACMPLNGIYFRFGHASRGAMAMAGGRETVYVGMEYVRNPWGHRYPRDFDVIQELEQLLLQKYAGRPHWGKNQAPMFDSVAEKYPRFAEFEAYRQQQDPDKLFRNPFYARVSGQLAPSPQAANCVVDQGCYCVRDENCPSGYHCQPGLVYPEARVCRP